MSASRKTARSTRAPRIVPVIHRYCAARFPKLPSPPRGMAPARLRLIRETAFKWMNGTTIRYWFHDSPARYAGAAPQKAVVRQAFDLWKAVRIGLDFEEAASREEADLRIAFDQSPNAGSWSYVGTDCLGRRGPTMNFGWDLTGADGLDTALHEIGHALGFPHEHQNPFAGIVWDEPAVYRSLAQPPNNWSRSTTYHNIIEKIIADTVQGSRWDPNSVMHYPFEPGLILKPPRFKERGLTPKGGLSARDKSWVRHFYPPLPARAARALSPFKSTPLALKPGKQADFDFVADATREYTFATFGEADTHLALQRRKGARLVPVAEDDDSGVDRNAQVKLKLKKGEALRVQVRMRYIEPAETAAVMAW